MLIYHWDWKDSDVTTLHMYLEEVMLCGNMFVHGQYLELDAISKALELSSKNQQ